MSNKANHTTSNVTTILHPVRCSLHLNHILQHLPDGVANFNYRGVNYRHFYCLIHYRGKWYYVPILQTRTTTTWRVVRTMSEDFLAGLASVRAKQQKQDNNDRVGYKHPHNTCHHPKQALPNTKEIDTSSSNNHDDKINSCNGEGGGGGGGGRGRQAAHSLT